MRTAWILFITALVIAWLAPQTLAEDLFKVTLVRAADLPAEVQEALSPTGNDPLSTGKVELEDNGRVKVEVRDALANTAYRVLFCNHGGAPRSCFGIGNFTTDNRGRAQVQFAFPEAGTFAGVFAIKRPATTELTPIQFVTGFSLPARAEDQEEE